MPIGQFFSFYRPKLWDFLLAIKVRRPTRTHSISAMRVIFVLGRSLRALPPLGLYCQATESSETVFAKALGRLYNGVVSLKTVRLGQDFSAICLSY